MHVRLHSVGASLLAVVLLIAAPLAAQRQQDGPRAPERPKASVEMPGPVAGRTVNIAADGDLQKAIDAAAPGDVIALAPGATYRGPFTLKRKQGTGWITITSAATDLPKPGQRVTPASAARMAKLVADRDWVVSAESGAHNYRLAGLHIAPADGVFLKTLVRLGEDERTLEALPHHIVIERSYLHGDPKAGSRRGVALNGRHMAVVDSHLADFKERGADSQAVSGWNGEGPFRLANNYLEAAGENVMFGGADPLVPGLVPSDIEIVRNHLAKPLRWKSGEPGYDGVEWSVKNLFELKNARRVLVDGNLLEYNWPAAQNGFAILFTVRNQDGNAPWSVVEDVTFQNNLVRHVAAGINILGRDDIQKSQQTRRIAIRNNVFLDVGGRWGQGRLFQLLDGTSDVTIDHNTAIQTGSILFGGDNAGHTNFVFQNNFVLHNEHGISGSSTDIGTASLARYFPDAIVRRNVIVGGNAGQYPRDNFFVASLEEAGQILVGEQLQVRLDARYAKNASDGTDPGASLEAVSTALGGVRVGLRDHAAPARRSRAIAPAEQREAIAPGARERADRTSAAGAMIVFWIALLLLGYTYAGYPVVAAIRAHLRPKPRIKAPIEPTVSIVVVAYNEADRIATRIANLLALDYPADRRQIVIASDGSTDDTVSRALRYSPAGVIVHGFRQRRGKSAVLNSVIPMLSGEIVMFADARQHFEPGTLRALVANFADPQAGAVSGQLVLREASGTAAASRGTAFYWQYEKFIRSTEGRADSTIGATGAIYAIRRELFQPIPDDTLLDDVLIPLRILRQGYRVLFEPEAKAYDSCSLTAKQEFTRKTRTIAGNFQLFARERWLLDPRQNRLWFETISHKALRLTLPVQHAALLVASALLATTHPLFALAFAGQALGYGLAAVGALRDSCRRSPVFSVPCALCLLNWATIVGFWKFVTDGQQATWERTQNARPAVLSPRAAGFTTSMPRPAGPATTLAFPERRRVPRYVLVTETGALKPSVSGPESWTAQAS